MSRSFPRSLPAPKALPGVRRLARALALLCLLLVPSTSGAAPLLASFHDRAITHQLIFAYSPSQIADAYNFDPLLERGIDGTGQTAALMEIDGYKAADLRQFDQQYGVPDPAIEEFYVGTGSFKAAANAETTMDLEWLHALAPGARLQVYYLNQKQSRAHGWRDMARAVYAAVNRGVSTVSISLGSCGASKGSEQVRKAFKYAMKKGVSVFVSSGDSGAHPGPDCGGKIGVAYPSGDPSVVAVGGTSLHLKTDNSIATEVAWSASGGGKVAFTRPLWQVASGIPHDKYRWAPDVAFIGDPHTGISMYWDSKWRQVGGTSVGAPAWAAAWLLIRQSAAQSGLNMSAAPPLLYSIANSTAYKYAFHDITSGSNGRYRAHVGWDPVTGWGTPDVNGLSISLEAAASH